MFTLLSNVVVQLLAAGVMAVTNPTGSCGVYISGSSNGGRLGYHSPGPNDVYVPDCNLQLSHEYWRVFVEGGTNTAYVIPRPDGMGHKYNLCDSSSLGQMLEKYQMCSDVTNPSIINSMVPEEALKITHALHSKLRFRAQEDRIDPWAPDDDILAVCNQGYTNNEDALSHCQRLESRCTDGICQEIAILPNAAAVEALVLGLNELYGIVNEIHQCGPVCAIACEHGNVLDAAGCPTCECRTHACPAVLCEMFCELGNVLDAAGCPLCQCKEAPTTTTTTTKYICGGPVCKMFCEHGNVLDAAGCHTCRCWSQPGTNPTGSCGVHSGDSTGGRAAGRLGYHSPGPNDVYVPDCNLQLSREYWRVFVEGGTNTAYVIPRPDGMGHKYNLCDSSSLGQMLEKYQMCSDDTNPSIINSMVPEEALKITHALHSKLRFRAQEDRIDPWAPDDDILAVCNHGYTNNEDALSHCQRLESRCTDGICQEIAILPNAAAVEALVLGLNELYGIVNDIHQCGPVCAIFCEHGNVLDAAGCPTCECRSEPVSNSYSVQGSLVMDVTGGSILVDTDMHGIFARAIANVTGVAKRSVFIFHLSGLRRLKRFMEQSRGPRHLAQGQMVLHFTIEASRAEAYRVASVVLSPLAPSALEAAVKHEMVAKKKPYTISILGVDAVVKEVSSTSSAPSERAFTSKTIALIAMISGALLLLLVCSFVVYRFRKSHGASTIVIADVVAPVKAQVVEPQQAWNTPAGNANNQKVVVGSAISETSTEASSRPSTGSTSSE